jgi:hypothetical protein
MRLQHFEQTIAGRKTDNSDQSEIIGRATMLINRVEDEQTRLKPVRSKFLSTCLRASSVTALAVI